MVGIQIVHSDTTIMSDDFESYTDELILADTNCYNFVNFPGTGAGDDGTCNSANWEMDTGSLKADIDSGGNNWGRTVGDGDGLWRVNTQQTASEPIVTFDYKAAGSNNATDVWLNYQTQYWLYVIQFDRDDNCIVAKRKVPTNSAAAGEWGGIGAGRSAEIANRGVYYVLRVDTGFAGSSCNQDGRTWASQSLANIAHDATLDAGTVYEFKATLETVLNGVGTCTGVSIDCTQLKLYRDGVLVLSWTDKNNGWNSSKTTTTQADCDAGYFTTVTGYQAAWCLPITAAGKSGIRNDASQVVWIDNFLLEEGGEGEPEPPPPTLTFKGVKSGNIRVNSGRINIR